MSEPRIINTWDQLQAARAADLLPEKQLLMIHQDRDGHGILVGSPFFDTDPDAAWYHHKKKAFFGDGRGLGRRSDAEAKAIAWVAETYGYSGPWAGNAMRDKVPAIVQKRFPIKRRP